MQINHVHLHQATTHLKSTRASFSNAKNNVIALEVNQEAVATGRDPSSLACDACLPGLHDVGANCILALLR